MAQVTKTKGDRQFIGKAWVNTVKNGTRTGTKFINVSLNKNLAISLEQGDRIQLWPNNKREGHEATDADFSVSVVSAAPVAA